MAAPQFKSGPWIGFYAYAESAQKHLMDLNLRFNDGKIEGDGADGINHFVITGFYDHRKMECDWKKIYPTHAVEYYGYRDGKGIWGRWKINHSKGGFHIWPLSEGQPPKLREINEEVPLKIAQAVPLVSYP